MASDRVNVDLLSAASKGDEEEVARCLEIETKNVNYQDKVNSRPDLLSKF